MTPAEWIALAGEVAPVAVDLAGWIAEQVRAAREGTEAQRAAALAALDSAHRHVTGLRASEQADHDAAVAGQ